MLVEGNIIHRTDRAEAGIIEGVVLNTGANGDEMTVTGQMGSSMLDQRIIIPTMTYSGAVELAMQNMVYNNCIVSRPIAGLALGTLGGYTPTCNFQVSYKKVLDTLKALSKSAPLGFRVRLDVVNKKWIFEVYDGVDRSTSQSAVPYVLFDDDNTDEPKYTSNNKNYKNYAYVGGEGDGDARTIITVDQTNGEARRELWVDARDLRKGDQTQEQYNAQLTQRGKEKLAGAVKTESLTGDADDTANFQYGKDWNLGDIVTFKKWGHELNQRITEVEEVDENGVLTITPVCGSPLPETLNLGGD